MTALAPIYVAERVGDDPYIWRVVASDGSVVYTGITESEARKAAASMTSRSPYRAPTPPDAPRCDFDCDACRATGDEVDDGWQEIERLRAAIRFTAIPTLTVFAEDNGGVREAVRILRAALTPKEPSE